MDNTKNSMIMLGNILVIKTAYVMNVCNYTKKFG